ncbi:ATP synthase F1 subunit epsilon [bacterium]|nr:ATP synthase F1 subunit epsilon [bacterium]
MDSLRLIIRTPEKDVLEQECAKIIAHGEAGYFTLLPRHTRFMSTLHISRIVIEPIGKSKRPEKEITFFIGGGILYVEKNKVLILTRSSEHEADIDSTRALEAKERAEKRLQEDKEKVDLDRALAALERASARLSIVQGRA